MDSGQQNAQEPEKPEQSKDNPTDTQKSTSKFQKVKHWVALLGCNKKLLFVAIGVVLAVLAATPLLVNRAHNKAAERENEARRRQSQLQPPTQQQNAQDMGDGFSADPIKKGKALSNNLCTGTGSKQLTYAPMRAEDMSVIIPYGLMAGGHVTPIDHQYYWGKDQFGPVDSYTVLAPADGTIVDISYRPHNPSLYADSNKIKGDYRVVISYSCTFFSYFDLATSLSPDIQAQLPAGWEQSNPYQHPKAIPVKAGQVLGHIGGQGLDYAVWDTARPLKNFLVPLAYNNAEPWKIVTVNPLNYYTQTVKDKILPLYAGAVKPKDGVIDQDVEGTAKGTWFKAGTNGYHGAPGSSSYAVGHLSFASDTYDPTGYVFSTGDFQGQPQQFSIVDPSVKPEQVKVGSGTVKYQIAEWRHTLNGQQWFGSSPGDVKFSYGATKGTVLVQLLDKHSLKVEVFPDKTPGQVTDFTAAAVLYNRGDDATK